MDWSIVKGMLSKAAPLIGGAIGGPGGSLVAGWIASELGEDVDPSDPVALEKAIKADPEWVFKIKQLEARNKEELQRMGLEVFKAEVADKDSARARELEMTKATGKRDILIPLMALLITGGFFSALAILLLVDLDQMSSTSLTIVNILIGVLGTNFNNVVGYLFGSSKGSADKTKMAVGK